MTDDTDDLLDSDEIEELLRAQQESEQQHSPEQPGDSAGIPSEDLPSELLAQSEIDELLSSQSHRGRIPAPAGKAPPRKPQAATPQKPLISPQTEQLLDQAEASLAEALGLGLNGPRGVPPELGNPKPFQYQAFDSASGSGKGVSHLQNLQDVELDLHIELGRAELLIDEVIKLKEGSVVPLDKLAGDPVEIIVNGRLVARGEVLVLNDNFCVRVGEILTPEL